MLLPAQNAENTTAKAKQDALCVKHDIHSVTSKFNLILLSHLPFNYNENYLGTP